MKEEHYFKESQQKSKVNKLWHTKRADTEDFLCVQ